MAARGLSDALPAGPVRLLGYAEAAGPRNMAVDQALLLHAEVPTLRFYGWDPPCVSLGHFQGRRGEDLSSLLGAGLPVVRRETGGGAIVHWHELTYSLLIGSQHPVVQGADTAESYARLHAPIRETLRGLGIEAVPRALPAPDREPLLCFHRVTELDLVVGERKLVGSAQRRRPGRILQHGSIVLSRNPMQPGTAALDDQLGEDTPSPEELATLLAPAFARLLGPLEPGDLTSREEGHAEAVAASFAVPG